MPATIKKVRDGVLSGFDDASQGTLTVEYMYEDLAPGDDIFRDPAIPAWGSTLKVKDTLLFLTTYGHERYVQNSTQNGSGKVTCGYGPLSAKLDETYIRWERTYKKENRRVPKYQLHLEFYTPVGQSGEMPRYSWVEQEQQIPVEMGVLSVTVIRLSHSLAERSDILLDMSAADAEMGKLHIIPQFGGTQWVMQPYIARQADPYRVDISYNWISDPGNSGQGYPTGADVPSNIKDLLIVPPRRPPWYEYQTISQQGLDGREFKPKILLSPLFPPSIDGQPNPYYNPNGWRSLPGKPFG
jgi:hypothetical protein